VTNPPPLDTVVAHAQDVARVLNLLTGGEYAGLAADEVAEGGQRLWPVLGNDLAWVHRVIDVYTCAAGDLLHGTAQMSQSQYNLAFSPAPLARSACEYATIAWWIADPEASPTVRRARGAALVQRARYESRKFLRGEEEIREYEEEHESLIGWVERHADRKQQLPNEVTRFESMNAEHGRRTYATLSGIAHGELFATHLTTRATSRAIPPGFSCDLSGSSLPPVTASTLPPGSATSARAPWPTSIRPTPDTPH